MNIGHRIHARKVALCYIYRALFCASRSEHGFEEKNQSKEIIPQENDIIDVPDGEADFMNSMGSLREEEDIEIKPGTSALSEQEDDLVMIADGLRIDALEIDWNYVYAMIGSYEDRIEDLHTIVDTYLTQFQRNDMELLKKSIFILGYTEKQVLNTDTKVIINEMIELAKRFGGYETYKLINSVLHKIMFKS